MLSYLTEQINEYLSVHGVVVDVILRSEHSLVEEEEMREVEICFVEREEEGKPTATVHLVLLPNDSGCEVEVEVAYAGETLPPEAAERLWQQAREVVPEVSLTEKKRYLEPGKCVEASLVLDYHFVVEMPATEEEMAELSGLLQQFSADLGKLVRL